MSQVLRGVVKWFNDAKGFGFIEHETGRDVFVHYSVIESDGFKSLKDGEEVDYELKEGEKGLHAARVIRKNVPKTAEQRVSVTKDDATNDDATNHGEAITTNDSPSPALAPVLEVEAFGQGTSDTPHAFASEEQEGDKISS